MRVKRTFGGRQIDQILRQSVLAKHAGNHWAVFAYPGQDLLDVPLPSVLEEGKKAGRVVVRHQGNVRMHRSQFLLRAFPDPWIDGKSKSCKGLDGWRFVVMLA